MSWDDRVDADEEMRILDWLHENHFRAGKLTGFVLHEPCGIPIYGSPDDTRLLEDHLIWCPYKQVSHMKARDEFAKTHNHLADYACSISCPGNSFHQVTDIDFND